MSNNRVSDYERRLLAREDIVRKLDQANRDIREGNVVQKRRRS